MTAPPSSTPQRPCASHMQCQRRSQTPPRTGGGGEKCIFDISRTRQGAIRFANPPAKASLRPQTQTRPKYVSFREEAHTCLIWAGRLRVQGECRSQMPRPPPPRGTCRCLSRWRMLRRDSAVSVHRAYVSIQHKFKCCLYAFVNTSVRGLKLLVYEAVSY